MSVDSLIPQSTLPQPTVTVTGKVVIDRAALRRAHAGMPWLSPDEVQGYEGDNGAFADAVDEQGLPLGTVLWDPNSDIRARLISTSRTSDPLSLLATRLERAERRRRNDLGDTGALRLVHGEADGVPGVYIDRFGNALHVDVDSPVLLPHLEGLLTVVMERQKADTIVLRQGRTRELWRGTTSTALYQEGRLKMATDLRVDDIRRLSAELDAMKRLRTWARGRTLDVFANGGGFAMQMADAGATHSTVVDAGLEQADRVLRFAKDNGLAEKVEVIAAEPLEWLKQVQRSFDLVVCHPPHEQLPQAEAEQRAVEIASSALRLVGEGSIFCARSSSTSLDDERFAAVLADAAASVRRRLQVLARLGPGPDHPTLAGTPMAPSILVLRVLSTG